MATRSLTLAHVKRWAVAETLIRDWDGGIVGLVNVTMAPDNKTVRNANFLLQDCLFPEIPKVLPCNKFFLPVDSCIQHELVLQDLYCSMF